MIQSAETYIEAGRSAGRARRQGDQARARHWYDWVRRAIAIEPESTRAEAQSLFDEAYRREATPRGPIAL